MVHSFDPILPVPVVPPETPLGEVIERMRATGCEQALIWQPGRTVELFNSRDLLDLVAGGDFDRDRAVRAQACPVLRAAQLPDLAGLHWQLKQSKTACLAVIDENGQPQGVITPASLCGALPEEPLEQEAILRNFYESAPLMMGIVELLEDDILMLSGNAATAAYLGTSAQQLQQRRASHFGIPPASIRESFERYSESGRLGQPLQFETLGDQGRWLSGTVFPLPAGDGRSLFSFIFEDISSRKSTEEALRKSEAKNRAILEAIPDLMFQLDRDGTFVEYKADCLKAMAFLPANLVGKKAQDVLPPDLLRALSEAMGAADSTGRPQWFEHEIDLPDGTTHQFEVRLVPGQSFGFLALVRDISERKRFQRQLEAAKEAAEAANQAKSRFLTMVSHELRTPLGGIIGLTSLMLFDSRLDAEQRETLETIHSSGETLLAIVGDILDFSKIESGRLELQSSPFNLRTCIGRVRDLLMPKAQEKSLQLTCQIDEAVPEIIPGDAVRVQQVLINLLGNAIKFTFAGKVCLTVSLQKAELLFRCCDSGIGIPAQQIDQLFVAFSQLDTSPGRSGGSGLGLAICKRLVALMGGQIWVESEPEVGSTFSFTLPLLPLQATEPSHQRSPIPRILLAEDSPTSRRVALQLLKRLGYQADAVGDGRQVLTALREQHYDIVLMDVQMPELDGLETARQIRREWGLPAAPRIIAMTTSSQPADHDSCFAAGMDDYLCKPIRLESLRSVLQRWK